VGWDLVVHMCVGIVELLQELVVKVLWLGGAEPNLLPSFRILNSELVSFVSTPL